MASRPELTGPPELHYNAKEARDYHGSSRIAQIQADLAARAIELLALPEGQQALLLDIGCGTGRSGECIDEAGHLWMGMDVSRDMLEVAVEDGCEGDLVHDDMGHGLPFRTGIFDGAISISAIQWLCYCQRREHNARQRLGRFFQTLYGSLHRGARAVLQLYPDNAQQLQLITDAAMRCGFSGGVVVDYPNSAKAKKYFLVIDAGVDQAARLAPKALGCEDDDSMGAAGGAGRGGRGGGFHHGTVQHEDRRRGGGGGKGNRRGKGKRSAVKSRDWVKAKKERARKQGKATKRDSKYSARRRPAPF
eukprot:g4705.t1